MTRRLVLLQQSKLKPYLLLMHLLSLLYVLLYLMVVVLLCRMQAKTTTIITVVILTPTKEGTRMKRKTMRGQLKLAAAGTGESSTSARPMRLLQIGRG